MDKGGGGRGGILKIWQFSWTSYVYHSYSKHWLAFEERRTVGSGGILDIKFKHICEEMRR